MSINNHFADLIPKQNQEDNFFSDLVPSAPQLGSATLGAAVGSVKAPYKWGGVDPVKGMDCSGATCYVAKQFGVKIPRTSIEQYKDKRAVSVSKDQLQPGDLVFFDTGVSKEKGRQVEGGKYVTHVGIYVGNGEFMHQSGDKQSGMSRAKLSHWQNKYIGAKRHAQINQQAALRGLPVPAEQRGLPQPTLKDVAKGVQQEARLADSANRRAGMRGADGNAFGDLIQARTPSIGSAPSGVAPVDLNAKVRDEFLSNASVAELIIALRKTGKPTTEESSWMQSKGLSGTPAENNAAIMAEVNRRGAGVLRAISPFVPKEVLEFGSSVVTSPLGSSIRMTDPGASPEEMVAGGVDFAGSFMGLPLLDDAIKIVGKGISAASKSAIAKKIASKLSSQADWEKFRQSVEQMNIPAAQKKQIIQEVAPKVKPKTVKPKTIADVVDPELAAARKGMEGRQPRTAPIEVKPKVTPEAKEPKVAPTDSMRRALVAHGGFSEKQIDALAASLNPIIEQNPGAVFKAVKKIDPSGKLLQEWAQPFYSKLEQVAREKIPNRAPAEQIRKTLIGAGVKPEEMTWTRMDELLDRGGTISKQDLLDHLQENQVRIEEVWKGKSIGKVTYERGAWGGYIAKDPNGKVIGSIEQNPSGTFKIYNADGSVARNGIGSLDEAKAHLDRFGGKYEDTKFGQYTLPGGEDYRELLLTLPPKETVRANFTGSHWDEPNVLAHIRFDTRKGPNGEKILHVAEIQSDWHQKGRKEGYAKDAESMRPEFERAYEALKQGIYDDAIAGGGTETFARQFSERQANRIRHGHESPAALPPEWRTLAEPVYELGERIRGNVKDAVPDAPFKKNWHELAMKRVLRYAAENDFDRVSWDTGITNAERYDLSKQVDSIKWYDPRGKVSNPVGVREVTIEMPNSNGISLAVDESGKVVTGTHAEFNGKSIDDVVGKEIAQKIMDNEAGDLSGDGLKVGGEGMKGFYDKILPETANKMGKRFGLKVDDTTVPLMSGDWEKDFGVHFDGERWIATLPGDNTKSFSTEAEAVAFTKNIAESGVKQGHPAHSIAITPEMKASLLGEGQPLFQQGKEGIKGAYNPATRVIELVKGKADVSTVIHEVAHDWHGFLKDHAEFGPTIRQAYGDSVEGAEKFARHFEGFLRTGKAPSKPLAQVFTAIREWMAKIYSQFSGGKAPKEVEAIFKKVYENPSEETLRLAKEFDAKYAPKAESKVKAPSGANKADRVKQAESLGTPMPEVVSGKTLKQLEARGKKDIASGYDAPAEMARLAKGGLAANEREIAAFVAHRSNLLDELRGLNKRLDGNITDEVREAINLQKDELMDRIGQFDTNLDQIKGTAARSLGTLRIGQTVNWSSLDEIKLEAKRRTGVELSEKQLKTIEKELDAQKELVKTKDARITELEAAKADAVVREVRRVPRKASIEQIRAERKQLFQDVKDILAEAKKNQVVGAGLGVFQSYMEASPELAKKVIALLKTYVDEFKFQTAKELSDQLLKDFPELGATEDDVRKVLAGVYDQQTARPQSDWQKIKGESRKIENRVGKLQEQEGVLRTGITVARDKRVIQKSREVEMLDLRIRLAEKRVKAVFREKEKTLLQKGAREAFGTFRMFRLGADFGAVLRQGLYGLSRPKEYAKSLGNAFRGMSSDEALLKIEESYLIKEHDGKLLEPIRKRAGLSTSDTLSDPEEAFVAKWIQKVPGLKKLERGQSAFLNSLRREMMDSFIRNTPDATLKELQDRARFINNLTGRGNLKQVPELLQVIMTSPRYTASRWGMLGEVFRNPANLKSKGARANIQDMAVSAAGVFTLLKMAESAGLEVNFDPTNADFLKIRDGENVYDPTAGMATVLRTAIGTAIMIGKPGLQTPYRNPVANLGRVALNTTSPGVRAPLEQTTGKSLTGFDIDEDEKGFKAFVPLIVSQFWSAVERGDDPKRVASQTGAEFLGIGVNRYPKSQATKP